MSYIDVTGKTEDEALRKGLEQLGMDRDDVSVSILERAKSGFLGIGASPARIRITYGPEEAEVAAPAEVKIIPEEEPAAPVQPAPAKAEEPAAARSDKYRTDKPRTDKPRPQRRPEQSDRPRPERRERPALRLLQHIRRQHVPFRQKMPVGKDRVRACIAAGQLAQAGDRFADRRVPRKRFIPAAATLDVFQTPAHSLIQPGGGCRRFQLVEVFRFQLCQQGGAGSFRHVQRIQQTKQVAHVAHFQHPRLAQLLEGLCRQRHRLPHLYFAHIAQNFKAHLADLLEGVALCRGAVDFRDSSSAVSHLARAAPSWQWRGSRQVSVPAAARPDR